ncbi:MAG TPA: alpha-glucan family phosphorylase, partial [Geminicoccaceae bacterium]
MSLLDDFVPNRRIAYFSMEIALRPEIHTYAGGLGLLAGDVARACADLELPIVFVTLISRNGYLCQEIDDVGRQVDRADPWAIEPWLSPLGAKIALRIEWREVWVRPWLYLVEGPAGYEVPVILLDTDLEENAPEDRRITHRLYGGDQADRLRQEIVLGIGGLRILRALGFGIHTYHLNEGHAALLGLDLLRRYTRPADLTLPDECSDYLRDLCTACIFDLMRVRELCVFTTHTPVEAGQDRFPYPLVEQMLGDFMPVDQLKLLGGAENLNMTRVALNLSGYVNGVAERHAETSRRMFRGYRFHAITNGVHASTWTFASFARLYQAHIPHWQHEPELLVRADRLPDEQVWRAHMEAKRALLSAIQELQGVTLDPDLPLIVWARRMTGYKRPELLFSDPERLAAIARRQPFQVVFAGKAHPQDASGKDAIASIHRPTAEFEGVLKVVFLPNYEMALARTLVAGADVWLNTPLPPMEASGTSGMKAALNGVLNLGVPDGWWAEAAIDGETGWAIGDGMPEHADRDAGILYDKLEHEVLPLYHTDRTKWIWMMKQSISKIGYYFN